MRFPTPNEIPEGMATTVVKRLIDDRSFSSFVMTIQDQLLSELGHEARVLATISLAVEVGFIAGRMAERAEPTVQAPVTVN